MHYIIVSFIVIIIWDIGWHWNDVMRHGSFHRPWRRMNAEQLKWIHQLSEEKKK